MRHSSPGRDEAITVNGVHDCNCMAPDGRIARITRVAAAQSLRGPCIRGQLQHRFPVILQAVQNS